MCILKRYVVSCIFFLPTLDVDVSLRNMIILGWASTPLELRTQKPFAIGASQTWEYNRTEARIEFLSGFKTSLVPQRVYFDNTGRGEYSPFRFAIPIDWFDPCQCYAYARIKSYAWYTARMNGAVRYSLTPILNKVDVRIAVSLGKCGAVWTRRIIQLGSTGEIVNFWLPFRSV